MSSVGMSSGTVSASRTEIASSRSDVIVKAIAGTGKSSGSYVFSTVTPSSVVRMGSSAAASDIPFGVCSEA
jgi:hypothetical protein